MSDFHIETDGDVGTILKVVAGVLGIFLVFAFIIRMSSFGGCGVVNRTLDSDNIIFNYEMFHDVSEKFKAKAADIAAHAELVATAKAEGDKRELSRLRMELAALKSSCRSLASEYNADSEKMNRQIFKSKSLPHTLALSDCE